MTGLQVIMGFKDSLDAEFKLSARLEKHFKKEFRHNYNPDAPPELALVHAIFYQALLDSFNQIREVRNPARDWLLSEDNEPQSAEWYAEMSDFYEPLKRMRAFLKSPDYNLLMK